MVICALACSSLSKDKFQQPGPIHLDRDGEKWAEKTLRTLSVEEKVGQLFMAVITAELSAEYTTSDYYRWR